MAIYYGTQFTEGEMHIRVKNLAENSGPHTDSAITGVTPEGDQRDVHFGAGQFSVSASATSARAISANKKPFYTFNK